MKTANINNLDFRHGQGSLLRRLATPFSLVALAVLLSITAAVPTAVAQNAPGAVTNLNLSSESPGELTISWTAPEPPPSDYRLAWAEQGLAFLSYQDLNESNRGNEYPDGQETSFNPHWAHQKARPSRCRSDPATKTQKAALCSGVGRGRMRSLPGSRMIRRALPAD